MGNCDPGLRETATLHVADEHTAAATGSGDVEVLSTATVLLLAERACLKAIRDDVPEGRTTVGVWAEVEHERPVPVGADVRADAVLVGHHGRRLEFTITVRRGDDVVARVRHRRTLLDREQFLARVPAGEAVA